MERNQKIEALEFFRDLPDQIRTAICAGMALGQLQVENKQNEQQKSVDE